MFEFRSLRRSTRFFNIAKTNIFVLLVFEIVRYCNLWMIWFFLWLTSVSRSVISSVTDHRGRQNVARKSCCVWHSWLSLRLPFFLNFHDILTTSVINYWTDVQQHGIWLTNRFHVAVRLFSNRSQMTSKCGKNKRLAHEA